MTKSNNQFKRIIGVLVTALSVLIVGLWHGTTALAAPKMETGIGLPKDISVDGHRIDWLLGVTNLFVTILFIMVCLWILIACIKHGKKHTSDYDHGESKHTFIASLTVSALVFLIVDGNLFVNSMIDIDYVFWDFAGVEKKPDLVRIEINAHQWAWDARYAGPDGQFNTKDDVVTLNQINVPKDAPILFQLASVDVIHSFYLPNLRVKQDVVPGRITHLWFQATELGDFDIACAQHCGVNHYLMKAQLTVQNSDVFQEWIRQQSIDSVRLYETAVKEGGIHEKRFQETQWGWPWKKSL